MQRSKEMKKFNAMIVILLVLGLGVSARATVFYSYSEGSTINKDVLGTGTVTSNSSGLTVYCPVKTTAHAVGGTEQISGQGTEYMVTTRFKLTDFGVPGSTNPDNLVYLLMPMANGASKLQTEDSYSRDMGLVLYFSTTGGVSTAQLRTRSKIAGSVSNWAYTNQNMLTFGTEYEVRYIRYDTYMNVFFRAVGDDWTQLTYVNATTFETEDKFYFIGNHASDLTFNYLTSGQTANLARYKYTISSLVVESVVPEPATLCLVLSGFAGVILKKRR